MRFPRRLRLQTEWVWLAALLLAVSFHFWFPRFDPGFEGDSYSIGGEGKKAFFQLVQNRYGFAVRNSTPLASLVPDLDANITLCLLGPARKPTGEEWDRLLDWVDSGGSLVYAARFADPETNVERLGLEIVGDDDEEEEAEAGGDGDAGDDDAEEQDAGAASPSDKPIAMHAVRTPFTGVDGAGWQSRGRLAAIPADEVLVESKGSVQAVHRRYGAGDIVVVASDFVFSNQSLAWKNHVNGVLAVRILDSVLVGDVIIFDESLNESGTPKIVSILLTPMLRPMTVQLLIGLIVFGWWRSRRFGPLLPAPTAARRNIVDHTDALGTLYYRAREGSGVLRSYLKQLVWELRIRHSRGREKRVLRPLAAHLGRSVEEVGAEFREAGKVAQAKHVERHVAALHIRRLAELRRAAVETGLTRTRDPRPSRSRDAAEN